MSIETLKSLSIPERAGTIFVSPDFSEWNDLLIANKKVSAVLPQRYDIRNELLEIASDYTKNLTGSAPKLTAGENILATGHQATWHHCGIWAKNAAADIFAKNHGSACSLHLVLDHTVSDTDIRIPIRDKDGYWSFQKIPLELEQQAIPLEFRPAPAAYKQHNFIKNLRGLLSGSISNAMITELFEIQSGRSCRPADFITAVQAGLNRSLGIDTLYLPVSRLSQSEAFLNFAASIIPDCQAFADCYNNAVKYNARLQRLNPRQSLRQLHINRQNNTVELPFRLFSPDGRAANLRVNLSNPDEAAIYADSIPLGSLDLKCGYSLCSQLQNILRTSEYRLRPKAITLTLFVRLFIADLFIHGIGGAIYEPITDFILETHYRMNPVQFAVATCTAKLDLALPPRPKYRIPDLQHILHNIRHKPENFIDKSLLEQQPLASLARTKIDLIGQTKNKFLPGSIKKMVWYHLGQINEKLAEFTVPYEQDILRQLQSVEKYEAAEKVCSSREFFFGFFSRDFLLDIASVNNQSRHADPIQVPL